jgi:hypothetical protein
MSYTITYYFTDTRFGYIYVKIKDDLGNITRYDKRIDHTNKTLYEGSESDLNTIWTAMPFRGDSLQPLPSLRMPTY